MPDSGKAAVEAELRTLGEDEQKAFFELVLERAATAAGKLGGVEETLDVGGTIVRFRFAGAGLRDTLFPALSHLRVEAEPELTVHVWESAASGVALPPAPCPSECFTDRGEIWTMPSRSVRSAFHWSECSLSLLDLDRRTGVYWVRSADQLPYWTVAAPFRGLLNWWMEANGAQLLHAAAVGVEGKGVLITGKGGTGKSTSALACLEAGLSFVGDDYVIVSGGARPKAWSLYRTAKVNESDMARFGGFGPQLRRFGADEKAVIEIDAGHPGLVRGLELTAVLTPEFGAATDTRILPVELGRIRNAALFTTLCQLPHVGQQASDFIDGLLDRLPAYRLCLGGAREKVPAALTDFLRAPPAAAAPDPHASVFSRPPLVSVVIPVHNGARFLADAVGSVLAQGYPSLDIIVVDDGSLDDIKAAVAALPVDVRFLNQLNAGPAAARNRGILNAASEFVAFLDVDDLWTRDVLGSAIEAMCADDSIDVLIGRGQTMRQDPATGGWRAYGDPEKSFPYSIAAAVYRKRVFRSVGLFDERLRFAEDSDWYLRAEESDANIVRVSRTTLLVRRHDANMTAGKAGVELVPLRLFKNVLERRRGKGSG